MRSLESGASGAAGSDLSVFLRDGDVFRTYFTSGRGVEALCSAWTFLDLTPLGRQEEWEDSPEGWPQTPPFGVVAPPRRYEDAATRAPPRPPSDNLDLTREAS